MKEEKVYIKNGNLVIEGLFYKSSKEKGVVICHPHSLMGGSMYNNVVETVQEAFAAGNMSTLRFNFRGVGGSTGTYEEGIGEQKDIIAVCEYLKNTGISELFFAGYSFGAWVGSKIIGAKDNPFSFVICVSPPIDYFNFEWDDLKNKIDLFVCGDRDQFCTWDILSSKARKINSLLEKVSGADHFYMGKEEELAGIMRKHITKKT
ncbi:MAG: hypothetical protein LLG40_03855 [Deltaproteobacteria bacterium]|nr:hypothetical protein [Deltaproteobacteria bacterium]